MRTFALLALGLGLAACSSPQNDNLATMVGAGNAAAVQAAAACDFDEALVLAQRETGSSRAETRLFSQFTQSAIYTETGDTAKAAAAVDTATNDPALNPDGASRAEMQQGADALLQMVRGRRVESTGTPNC